MIFLDFEHTVRDGLHTYTARADRTLVEAVWRAVAWAVTEGLQRCAIPKWVRNSAAITLGVDRTAVRLVRWEYDADAGPAYVPATSTVHIMPPADQWELDHRDFAGLFALASFADLTLLDSVVQHEIRAQVTVFGLGAGRFDDLAAALDDPDRPPPPDLLRPGEMLVSLATVRDSWFTGWDNTLTVATPPRPTSSTAWQRTTAPRPSATSTTCPPWAPCPTSTPPPRISSPDRSSTRLPTAGKRPLGLQPLYHTEQPKTPA